MKLRKKAIVEGLMEYLKEIQIPLPINYFFVEEYIKDAYKENHNATLAVIKAIEKGIQIYKDETKKKINNKK